MDFRRDFLSCKVDRAGIPVRCREAGEIASRLDLVSIGRDRSLASTLRSPIWIGRSAARDRSDSRSLRGLSEGFSPREFSYIGYMCVPKFSPCLLLLFDLSVSFAGEDLPSVSSIMRSWSECSDVLFLRQSSRKIIIPTSTTIDGVNEARRIRSRVESPVSTAALSSSSDYTYDIAIRLYLFHLNLNSCRDARI